jgi:hypothetical protein
MARSIVNPDGSVDISRLEREIREDLSLHRKHAAEDGMKKKAIHTSADYDEFQKFVSAAQLKPTTSRDVSSLFTGSMGSISRRSGNAACRDGNQVHQGILGGYGESIQRRKDAAIVLKKLNESNAMSTSGGFNVSSRHCGSSEESVNKNNSLVHKSSRKAYDFLGEWKEQCKSPEQTLSFLTRIKAPGHTSDSNLRNEFAVPADGTCNEYFSAEIDSEILGDIVDGMHYLMSQNDQVSSDCQQCLDNIKSAESNVMTFMNDWLRSLAGCGRFGLSVSFLTSEQTKKLKSLVEFAGRSSVGESGISDMMFVKEYEKLLK